MLFSHCDIEWTTAFSACIIFWPILLAFFRPTLFDIGNHGDSFYLLLPYQSPKVSKCPWKGAYTGEVVVVGAGDIERGVGGC